MTRPASNTINVQDPFFYQLRKDACVVHVYLVSGKRLSGVLKRFDRYAIVLENQHTEQLVYKHAIATVCLAKSADHQHDSD